MSSAGVSGPAAPGVHDRVISLAEQYRLPPTSPAKLLALLRRLADDPHAPTSVRDPLSIVEEHFADSLVALDLQVVREARLVLDLGSGAGLPGLPLAVALPDTAFVLLESTSRKCEFLRRAAAEAGISNAEVVNDRAETYAEGRGRFDLVTARAVAGLEVVAEYAAPLLRVGGTAVVWAGRRSEEHEAAAQDAAEELGLTDPEVLRVKPFPAARDRHLYVMSKVMDTPDRFPRRAGVAMKRPLGGRAPRPSSD